MCSDIEERVLSPSIPTEPETRCSVSGSCPRTAQRSWAFRRRSPADPAVRPALHLGAHAGSPARLQGCCRRRGPNGVPFGATRWHNVDMRTFQLLRRGWLLAMGILVVLTG